MEAITLDCGAGVSLNLVPIPAGFFQMGSPSSEQGRGYDEGPVHTVELDAFFMGETEVTQAQYEAIMGTNPSNFKGNSSLPVEMVSWNDAMKFCEKLSAKTGKAVTLPTEAQWEYACRAGTTTPFSFGETISTEQANYDGNCVYGNGRKGEFRRKTVFAKSFAPNAWGLYNMHGNVWEWCLDGYEPYYAKSPDKNPYNTYSSVRVLRGGSLNASPFQCRVAFRRWDRPASCLNPYGFRVVLRGADSSK